MAVPTIQSSTTLPVAQPAYIFRGHGAQIHSLHFCRQNTRLLSGDSDGWIVMWDVVMKRPKAVWRAHESTILGIKSWGDEKIITHGRDNKLNVWYIKLHEEDLFSSTLPVDDPNTNRKQPWLLHSLMVNTLNFCSFSMCCETSDLELRECNAESHCDEALIAVPGTKDTEINIMHLPSEKRAHLIPALAISTGMVMTLSIFYLGPLLCVAAGYEGGYTALHYFQTATKTWKTSNISQTHTQPVLSLDVCLSQRCYFSSGADDIVCRHELPTEGLEDQNSLSTDQLVVMHTKHSGQQALHVRSDQKIFATAGWDSRVRVYSTGTMKELAVLKWHKEGCYAIAFANVSEEAGLIDKTPGGQISADRYSRTAQQRREEKIKGTHWLAAGSKDAKVSLWIMY